MKSDSRISSDGESHWLALEDCAALSGLNFTNPWSRALPRAPLDCPFGAQSRGGAPGSRSSPLRGAMLPSPTARSKRPCFQDNPDFPEPLVRPFRAHTVSGHGFPGAVPLAPVVRPFGAGRHEDGFQNDCSNLLSLAPSERAPSANGAAHENPNTTNRDLRAPGSANGGVQRPGSWSPSRH